MKLVRERDNQTNQNRCQIKGTDVMLRCRLVAERKGLPCTVTPEEVKAGEMSEEELCERR